MYIGESLELVSTITARESNCAGRCIPEVELHSDLQLRLNYPSCATRTIESATFRLQSERLLTELTTTQV